MELLPLLFVLGICSSLALGNDVKTSPPEDLDGSGDDEDFSGSGVGIGEDTEDGDIISTTVAPLVPTVTQVPTAPKLDIAFEDKMEENTTQHIQTTTPHDPIEDLFAVQPVDKEPFIEEGTTVEPTSHPTSAGESVIDVKKHHHHHTTLPVTSVTEKFDVIEETTESPAEDEKLFVAPEETTTSTPDEGNVDDLVEVIPTPEDSVHVDHPETTSGLSSTSSAYEEETTAEPSDIDVIPGFVDSVEKTTVMDDSHKHQHHHPHHPHHHTTTAAASTEIPLDGSDIETEKTDYLEPEDQDQRGEATTTTPSEDEHHDHHHHKHHHHHTTTPGATHSVTEEPRVHTQEPKGRRINIPPAEATTGIPVSSEDEEPVGTTVQYVHPVSPTQDDDTPDSTDDDSGDGSTDVDMFFEATAPVDKNGKTELDPKEGSSGASHGIMERKELLAGIIAGGIAGLVFAASLVAFVFYRMKKKDEGSYSLEEPKQSNGGYQKPREQREFYA